MVGNRFLVKLLVVVLVGSALVFWGLHVIKQHNLRNEAAKALRRHDISVTIVEGRRREEIAAQLDKAGVTSYADFLSASANYEGQLFPDTYRFFPNTAAAAVVTMMTSNYASRVADLKPTADQLVLASIIEREALNNADRATIAGVYQNRLNLGMTLGSDPTVQYGKDTLAYQSAGSNKNFIFWKEITQADYQNVKSPFNTYLAPGLPPAPICNPGLQSIVAAQHPASHDYLYFGYKNGKLLLAKTLAEHQAQLK